MARLPLEARFNSTSTARISQRGTSVLHKSLRLRSFYPLRIYLTARTKTWLGEYLLIIFEQSSFGIRNFMQAKAFQPELISVIDKRAPRQAGTKLILLYTGYVVDNNRFEAGSTEDRRC